MLSDPDLWPSQPTDDNPPALARQFARTFTSPEGAAVLEHLRRLTVERRTPPDLGLAELRHLEGQRQLVLHIHALVKLGLGPT